MIIVTEVKFNYLVKFLTINKTEMKTVVIVVTSLCIVLSTFCQDTSIDKKIKFSSINQVGLPVGANQESAMVQTINGIRKDKWFAGVGVGLDFYVERGVPLFIDIRRDVTDKKNTAFFYADGGIYFPWPNFTQKGQKLNSSISAGAYYDAGIGWKLTGKNKRSFLMSVGYSLKQGHRKNDGAKLESGNTGDRKQYGKLQLSIPAACAETGNPVVGSLTNLYHTEAF